MSRLSTFLIAGLCTVLALGLGMWLGGHPDRLAGPLQNLFVDDERAVRAEVERSIRQNFIRPVDERRLDDASLKGMVDSLGDEFSNYFTPEEARRFQQSVEGQFEGVGMSVEKVRRGLQVLMVFEGSPAQRQGIVKGDVITRVNGKSIAGESANVATAKIKGPPGTRVKLSVFAPETKKTRTLDVRRERIDVPVVRATRRTRDGRQLAHVRLATFSSGAHGKLRQEIDKQLRGGAKGILLDLRGNGGGLLQEAVLVSSIFIEKGLVVSTDGRSRARREFQAQGGAIKGDVPVVVLVDQGSASASEIVTGALRDTGRATVVGTKTFGKGIFQEVEPLSNKGALDLTVGQYFLPKGENIQKKGITPSVRARDLPRTRRDEGLPVALRTLADKVR